MSDKMDTSGTISGHVREMTATDELLPCPFCGGKAEFRSGSSTTPYIRCRECGGRTKSSYDKAKLVAAWNRRLDATLGRGTCHPIISDNLTESEGMGDAWADCSECGHLLFVLTDPNSQPPNYCPNCGAKVVE